MICECQLEWANELVFAIKVGFFLALSALLGLAAMLAVAWPIAADFDTAEGTAARSTITSQAKCSAPRLIKDCQSTSKLY
jgi:hypothetical protein